MTKLAAVLLAFTLVPYVFAQTGQQTATVTLSVAQLQNLRDTPVVLIPAPGQGQVISPVSATFHYNFAGQHYAGGHGRLITTLGPYDTAKPISAFDDVLTAGFLDQDNDQTVTLQGNPSDPSVDVTNFDLEIVNFGPPLADGDGTLTITVIYTVEALP